MMMTTLTCSCGQFELEVMGSPMVAAECHCNSCRTAAEQMDRLPLARPMLEDNGGTRFVLYRKDRVRITRGQDLMRAFWLGPKTPTRRVVARCCNSPVFLEFKSGHWLSLYSSLWPEGTAPQPQLRTMVSDLGSDAVLDDAIASGTRQTLGFYGKLLAAWIAMGFKTPKYDIKGEQQP